MSKIYVTTAIPYVNGTPHIGHAVDYTLADIFARYQRSLGNSVRFQAGTDEHGNKIYKKALDSGLTPDAYVNENSEKFKDFIKKLGVEYTDFIRTTDLTHQRRVQEIWEKLSDHIYKDSYKGWYCEGCERFVTDKEYEENDGTCPDHQSPYEKLSEKNYYFRISDFKDQIKSAILSREMTILPDYRANEVLKLLDDSPDVSISRPTAHLPWGVPVPGDKTQVMYVWLDALSNYITVLGYPDEDISDYWPASVQIVGKDILRFHAIIWPAILLGLGLPLPKKILSHGFVLADGQKMSKSIGNVVDPIEVIDRHGLDAFRYYFSRHVDTFSDADFTWEKFENAYNNELANDLGNLVSRLATLCAKNEVSLVDPAKDESLYDNLSLTDNPDAPVAYQPSDDAKYLELMDSLEFSKAIDYAWTKLQALNRRIDETKPWSVAKDNPDEAKKLLVSLVSDLLEANALLKPFLPITEKIENIFTAEAICPPDPLFPKNNQ